jgi:hypothetical protein
VLKGVLRNEIDQIRISELGRLAGQRSFDFVNCGSAQGSSWAQNRSTSNPAGLLDFNQSSPRALQRWNACFPGACLNMNQAFPMPANLMIFKYAERC